MIEICNVNKFYKNKFDKTNALNDINLKLPSKGFIGLCGENGCGKSTLLNLISTVDLNFNGEIKIDGLNIKDNVELVRSQIVSYMFQEDFFVENLTVSENLTLVNSSDIITNDMLNYFEIAEKKNSYTNTLSGGQKQRIALLRTLIKEYKILLVDEPTCSMNEEMEEEVFKKLKSIANDKLVVLVSHNHNLLNKYCEMIIKLKDGCIYNIFTNETTSDIKIDKNIITFENKININLINYEMIDNIISKYSEIVIKTTNNEIKQKQFDYSISKYDEKQNTFNHNKSVILFKSFMLSLFGPSQN